MSNIKQALESAIEWIERYADRHGYHTDGLLLINKLKISLDELEKCEPVGELILDPAFLPALKAPLVNWKINLVDLEVGTKFYTSPQPRECEPVAEAIRERDRLGFAVVNVIGKLDEIIENTQEVEIDDFLNIAVPIDMWNELQAALEDMPKRADLYTSPQHRDWVNKDLLETDDGKWDATLMALWRRLQGRHPNAKFWNVQEIPEDEMYIFRAHFATALLASPLKQINTNENKRSDDINKRLAEFDEKNKPKPLDLDIKYDI